MITDLDDLARAARAGARTQYAGRWEDLAPETREHWRRIAQSVWDEIADQDVPVAALAHAVVILAEGSSPVVSLGRLIDLLDSP